MFDSQGFAVFDEGSTVIPESVRVPSPELVNECENLSLKFGNEPHSASELANYFSVSDRAVQNWFGLVTEAYRWLPESELKTGNGKNTRYTALCIEKMQELKVARDSGLTAQEWIKNIQAQNADRLQQPTAPKAPTAAELKATSALMKIAASSSPFSGLAVQTKATERVETLSVELQKTEAQVEADFAAFMEITAEIITQDEAADLADDLEFERLRKQNAAKWLRRKAILENDKQQILQGNLASPKQPGNAPVAVS